MAVHVVRDTGGDWRTALANSFLAPLLTGLVNNHFEGLRTAKENALLGELANAAGNMPNTTPEQGNGFAGQFTPPGMMQGGQGGGLNQLFNILGNPRFKSVNAARAMELAKPFLTEQFYNGFNPADTAQMMRGMGMGYVPKEAASYYMDMYKHQNPHQSFQNMNLGDRVVYGGFNPANGQFTQGGEMAVGMDPYNAGKLTNERQKIANDYALGIRLDDTDRYKIDTDDRQFGAELGYKNRQQDWFENPENPRNRTEKQILTDAEGRIVRIDPFAEAGPTGFNAAPQTAQTNNDELKKIYSERANLAKKEAAKMDAEDGELANLKMRFEGLEPNSAEANEALKRIQAMEAKQRRLIDEGNIYDQLRVNPNAENYFDSTGQVKPIPQQYRIQANPQAYANAQPMSAAPQGAAQTQPAQTEQAETPRPNARISAPKRDADGIMRVTPAEAEQMIAVLREYNPNMSMQDIAAWFEANRIIAPNIMPNFSLLDTFYSIGRANPQTAQPQSRPQAQPKAQPQPSTQPQRTDTAAAMEAISGDITPQTAETENGDIAGLTVSAIKQEIKDIEKQMKINSDWKRSQPAIGRRLIMLKAEFEKRKKNMTRTNAHLFAPSIHDR